MKTMFMLMAVCSLWLAGELSASTQTNVTAASSQTSGLKKTLSAKPFLGTKSVLTLGGDYVNTPKEEYETSAVSTKPLALEEMHGMIAEFGFGEAIKQGEWQLRFKRKLMTMDPAWQGIADGARNLSLSDRRSQVLKFSYNLRDWWQVGVAAMVEDKMGSENSFDIIPMSLHSGESLGFQIDTNFKF